MVESGSEARVELETLVIGGGVTGLAVGWLLAAKGERVQVLERADRLGGAVQTEECEGYLCEAGPNSMLILSVVIVPAQNPNGFGSLFEINSEDNQILISSATVDNVEIITSITADKLKATGTVVTSSTVTASTTSTVASVSDTTTSSGSSGGYY